jgi:hypothetical protein
MRGTLHLIAAEDYGWLVPLVLEPRTANAHRRLRQEGLASDEWESAVRAIERMLARHGPLDRSAIAERLRRRGIRAEGQAMAHLLWLAAARGVLCHGPDRGRDRCFVLVRDWLGTPQRMDAEAASTELAVRYLAAHGPSEPADLAVWSGLTLSEARRSWRAIADRLVEVQTSGRTRWRLRSADPAAARRTVRLLPAFDEYILGWSDRGMSVPAEHRKSINRGGGWIRPVLLVDGRALGTWSSTGTPDALNVEVRAFVAAAPWIRRAVDAEAADVAAFRGVRATPSVRFEETRSG